MDVSAASYYINTKIMKTKVAEWGTPKKIFKKIKRSWVQIPAPCTGWE
jgi:hypothetical protein